MAQLTPEIFEANDFNNGNEVENKTIVNPADLNAIVKGVLWLVREADKLNLSVQDTLLRFLEAMDNEIVKRKDPLENKYDYVPSLYATLKEEGGNQQETLVALASSTWFLEDQNPYSHFLVPFYGENFELYCRRPKDGSDVGEHSQCAVNEETLVLYVIEQLGEFYAEYIADLADKANEIPGLLGRISTAESEIEFLKSVVEQTIIAIETYEDTYYERTTADGVDIIDRAETKVLKVQGNTVSAGDALTNATFSGIVSASADGSESDTYYVQEIELGIGDTLDVASQKINRYTFVRTVRGTEGVYSWGSFGYNVELPASAPIRNTAKNNNFICNKYAIRTTANPDQQRQSIHVRVTSDGRVQLYIRDLDFNSGVIDTAAYKSFLAEQYAAGTPLIVAYECVDLQSIEDVIAPSSYIAYNGGTETVIGNGIEVTVTQDYLVKTVGN